MPLKNAGSTLAILAAGAGRAAVARVGGVVCGRGVCAAIRHSPVVTPAAEARIVRRQNISTFDAGARREARRAGGGCARREEGQSARAPRASPANGPGRGAPDTEPPRGREGRRRALGGERGGGGGAPAPGLRLETVADADAHLVDVEVVAGVEG